MQSNQTTEAKENAQHIASMMLKLRRQEWMDRLIKAQNHPRNSNQDIVTFSAFLTEPGELENHVLRYEEYCAEYDSKHNRAA